MKWITKTAPGVSIHAAPAITGDQLPALDPATGTTRWSSTTQGRIDYGRTVADGKFTVTTNDGQVHVVGPCADIYVFDSISNRVQKFDPGRKFIKQWGTPRVENSHFSRVTGTVGAAGTTFAFSQCRE